MDGAFYLGGDETSDPVDYIQLIQGLEAFSQNISNGTGGPATLGLNFNFSNMTGWTDIRLQVTPYPALALMNSANSTNMDWLESTPTSTDEPVVPVAVEEGQVVVDDSGGSRDSDTANEDTSRTQSSVSHKLKDVFVGQEEEDEEKRVLEAFLLFISILVVSGVALAALKVKNSRQQSESEKVTRSFKDTVKIVSLEQTLETEKVSKKLIELLSLCKELDYRIKKLSLEKEESVGKKNIQDIGKEIGKLLESLRYFTEETKHIPISTIQSFISFFEESIDCLTILSYRDGDNPNRVKDKELCTLLSMEYAKHVTQLNSIINKHELETNGFTEIIGVVNEARRRAKGSTNSRNKPLNSSDYEKAIKRIRRLTLDGEIARALLLIQTYPWPISGSYTYKSVRDYINDVTPE